MPSSDVSAPHPHEDNHSHGELRRDVTVWGSFMWGYRDVGADIYAALGFVIVAARGAAPLAFGLAGLAYILIGLAYTELASTYPVAGGGQYFTMRGLGDFWGFVAGSGLMLDYTVDISLFAVMAAGYLNFLFRLFHFDPETWTAILSFGWGSFHYRVDFQWMYLLEALLLIAFLIAINIRGKQESSLLGEFLGVADIFIESGIIICGFILAWRPELLAGQWAAAFHQFHESGFSQFAYGSSLAIITFIGLESISQAAQETRRPDTVVPRASISLIFSVFIFAMAFSILSLGVLHWQSFPPHVGDSIAFLAGALPYIGVVAGPLAAVLGFVVLLISSNAGIMGVSRLAYAMGRFNMLDNRINKVHPKYLTPSRAIWLFSGIAVLETVLAFLTPDARGALVNLYAFGATLGYVLVFLAMFRLRFSDPYSPRPYRMPLNLKLNYKGEPVQFPLLALVGIAGVGTILFWVVWTHAIGRIAGPAWVILCVCYYLWHRKKNGLPVFGSIKYDWEAEQKEVLESAEEFMLLEEYRYALAERDKKS